MYNNYKPEYIVTADNINIGDKLYYCMGESCRLMTVTGIRLKKDYNIYEVTLDGMLVLTGNEFTQCLFRTKEDADGYVKYYKEEWLSYLRTQYGTFEELLEHLLKDKTSYMKQYAYTLLNEWKEQNCTK